MRAALRSPLERHLNLLTGLDAAWGHAAFGGFVMPEG